MLFVFPFYHLKVQFFLTALQNFHLQSEESILKNFYIYFSALDQRRKTNFTTVFPELSEWWDACKLEEQCKEVEQ